MCAHRESPFVAPLVAAGTTRPRIVTGAAVLALAFGVGGARRRAAAQATPGASPKATPAAPIGATEEAALAATVDGYLAQTNTPGALVGVWYPGRGAWTYAAGIGDLATAAPVTLDDHVRIASITKTFTATVVLQLVDEGAIGLDDVLEAFVPGIANGDRITLRQVLGMTAGIFDFVGDPDFAAAYAADPLLPFSPEQAVDIVRRYPADFEPGAQVRYSNSNYVLLGLVVEQVAGQPVEVAIADLILAPLGLGNTSFATTPELPEPHLRGYQGDVPGDPLRDVTRSNPAVPWTAGAMVSTLADLRVWAEALAEGTLLSEEAQRERLEWGAFPGEGLDVRYGLGVLEVNGLVGHNGGIPGYSSWMVHALEEDATIVVVTNRASEEGGTADPIFVEIARLLFPDRFAAPDAPPAAATPAA